MAAPGVNPLVIDQLRSDPYFVVDFVVDNNPEGVMANLSSLGLLQGTPQELTRTEIKQEVREIYDPSTLTEVLSVAYDNEADNYTAGYDKVLGSGDDPGNYNNQQKAAGVGLMIFQGIAQIGQSVASVVASRNERLSAEEMTQQAQINADLQLQLQQRQNEFEESQRVFGIPRSAFIVVVVSFAVIIGLALLRK
jgi:hypothetical protein